MGCPTGELPSDPSGRWEAAMRGSIEDYPWYCYEGRVYVLVTAMAKKVVGAGGRGQWWTGYIDKLPGTGELDGESWGPLSTHDIFLSCLRAYTQNRNKNGWHRANPQDPTTLDAIIQYGTAAAGVWPFPICGVMEALDNAISLDKFGEKSKNYPCN